MPEANLLKKIVSETLGSEKYDGIDRHTVERICSEFIPRYKNYKDAVKAVKRELHIIYGSFLGKDCYEKAGLLLSGYAGDGGGTWDTGVQITSRGLCGGIYTDREFAARLLALHASTAERVGEITGIYDMLGGYIKKEDAVIDIGCGFNPFSIPFFSEIPCSYTAYDIDSRAVGLINKYFARLGPLYTAASLDAVARTPDIPAAIPDAAATKPVGAARIPDIPAVIPDAAVTKPGPAARTPDTFAASRVVLMFKLFPLLERQKKGRAFELLDTMVYNTAVVSFPTKSASGREKGMEAFYAGFFEGGLPAGLVINGKYVFKNEMFYIVARK